LQRSEHDQDGDFFLVQGHKAPAFQILSKGRTVFTAQFCSQSVQKPPVRR